MQKICETKGIEQGAHGRKMKKEDPTPDHPT